MFLMTELPYPNPSPLEAPHTVERSSQRSEFSSRWRGIACQSVPWPVVGSQYIHESTQESSLESSSRRSDKAVSDCAATFAGTA